MTEYSLIAIISVITAGLTVAVGATGAAIAEGRTAVAGLNAIAQQPDASSTLSRTLFVSLAMVESSAIYCFVVALILVFANPFWSTAQEVARQAAGG
ncbi:ATP synthase F0F1 subunit C [Steroidobacter denitrificans]|uniref:ATP synthase subunit c n=1 Tax=Steroidobacter denitrificans TaxID=465721 RepID=A0A127FDX4_STEDE|nr:F0F1 ATP synthase subunit C [Steroidobacter denitrificans]AMN48000.1 ATP synthase F0F1 subunit C [Steroidobacter denitrificans]